MNEKKRKNKRIKDNVINYKYPDSDCMFKTQANLLAQKNGPSAWDYIKGVKRVYNSHLSSVLVAFFVLFLMHIQLDKIDNSPIEMSIVYYSHLILTLLLCVRGPLSFSSRPLVRVSGRIPGVLRVVYYLVALFLILKVLVPSSQDLIVSEPLVAASYYLGYIAMAFLGPLIGLPVSLLDKVLFIFANGGKGGVSDDFIIGKSAGSR